MTEKEIIDYKWQEIKEDKTFRFGYRLSRGSSLGDDVKKFIIKQYEKLKGDIRIE